MRVTVKISRRQVVQKVHQLVNSLTGRSTDLAEEAKGIQLRIGTVLMSKISQAFEDKARGGRGEDGITWKPLAPATIRRRQKRNRRGQKENTDVEILRDTGLLFGSLSPGTFTKDTILQAGAGRVIVGTNQKPWHHRGTRRLPARPYWPPDGKLPADWWADILDALAGDFQAVLARSVTGE